MTTKKILSYGKLRGLQRCANPNGSFTILALDHRGDLRRALQDENNPQETYTRLVNFKKMVLSALAGEVTAVLLDPAYGLAPTIAENRLPKALGFIVTLEETGYAGEATARISRVAEGFSVGKIKRLGADAIKLLIYYHPDSPQAEAMRVLLEQIATDCRTYDLPLFLETLTYSLTPGQKMTAQEKRRAVIETARHLTPIGGDVYKTEFPLDVSEESDKAVWAEACTELSEAVPIPWVLLSAGIEHGTFVQQTRIACQSGASGILAGRSIWKEAIALEGEQRSSFLQTTAVARARELRLICEEHARPMTDFYSAPAVTESWYKDYPGLR